MKLFCPLGLVVLLVSSATCSGPESPKATEKTPLRTPETEPGSRPETAASLPSRPELASPRPLAIDDLFAIQRISETRVSPHGNLVAYTVHTPSLEKNQSTSHIWLVPAAGGPARRLTNHEKGETRPRWSADSQWIAFLSTRSGSQQVWKIAVDGGEAM